MSKQPTEQNIIDGREHIAKLAIADGEIVFAGQVRAGCWDHRNDVMQAIRRMADQREIPNQLSILSYLHCGKCVDEFKAGMAPGQSPKDYARLSVGMTRLGFQVWCNRHECNVLHIDFQGLTHPANTTAKCDEPPGKKS